MSVWSNTNGTAASTTTTDRPRSTFGWKPLLYSLPLHSSPIPWPAVPNYPIALESKDLREAYWTVLWERGCERGTLDTGTRANTSSKAALIMAKETKRSPPAQEALIALEQFARLLIARIDDLQLSSSATSSTLTPEVQRVDAESLLEEIRSILLPIKQFDRKWRTVVPGVIASESNPSSIGGPGQEQPDDDQSRKVKRAKTWMLDEAERHMVLDAFKDWDKTRKSRKAFVSEETPSRDEQFPVEHDQPTGNPVNNSSALVTQSTVHQGEIIPGAVTSAQTTSSAEKKDVLQSWTIQDESLHEWYNSLELVDTQIQAILALGLLSISSIMAAFGDDLGQSAPIPPKKSSTKLDPELLLDHLTDRLQIWRVMNDLRILDKGLPVNARGKDREENKGIAADAAAPNLTADKSTSDGVTLEDGSKQMVTDKDQVESWWFEIVQILFSHRVSSSVLSQHHQKLFPNRNFTSSQSDSNISSALVSDDSTMKAPPSPIGPVDRSLWSLHKSATKKRRQAEKDRIGVMESPTMKKLLRGNTRKRGNEKDKIHPMKSLLADVKVDANFNERTDALNGTDEVVFKIPELLPKKVSSRLLTSLEKPLGVVANDGGSSKAASNQTQPPRKQERPRPLPRGDALGGAVSSKRLFKREVSLPARASSLGLKRRKGGSSLDPAEMNRAGLIASIVPTKPQNDRPKLGKRKSVSPRKLNFARRAASLHADWTIDPFQDDFQPTGVSTKVLAPDTPVRSHASLVTASMKPKTFSRATSMPSFAALGAAFRPGMAVEDDEEEGYNDLFMRQYLPLVQSMGQITKQQQKQQQQQQLQQKPPPPPPPPPPPLFARYRGPPPKTAPLSDVSRFDDRAVQSSTYVEKMSTGFMKNSDPSIDSFHTESSWTRNQAGEQKAEDEWLSTTTLTGVNTPISKRTWVVPDT